MPAPPAQMLHNLTSLNLYGCKRIGNNGDEVSHLVRLPLKALSLGHTRVCQSGLVHIAQMTQLTELHIIGEDVCSKHPDIGGNGLRHLTTLTQLEVLTLRDLGDGELSDDVARVSSLLSACTHRCCGHEGQMMLRQLMRALCRSLTWAGSMSSHARQATHLCT
jgi:hypothetical protein